MINLTPLQKLGKLCGLFGQINFVATGYEKLPKVQ